MEILLADEIKGDLFPEAEFWSNSRVILNMSCNSVRVSSHGWREGALNETFFGKSFGVTGISDQMSRL